MSWFAAKTKFKGEFKALDFFKSIGVKSYVPYYKTKRVWSDRIKKVTVPAISGYVFFYLPKINYDIVNINPFTKNIVKGLDGLPAIITDNEMNTLKKYLKGEDLMYGAKLFEGQRIKIGDGPFIYKKGTINKIGCSKVVINIEAINISLILNKSSVTAA